MSTHSLKEEYELCRVGNRSHEHFKLKVDDTYVYNFIASFVQYIIIVHWRVGWGVGGRHRLSVDCYRNADKRYRDYSPGRGGFFVSKTYDAMW